MAIDLESIPKDFIDPVKQYVHGFKLAEIILDSGIWRQDKPIIIKGVMRGGAVAALVVNEVLSDVGIDSLFSSIFAKSYKGTSQDSGRIVKLSGYTFEPWNMEQAYTIILVDDTHDTGNGLSGVSSDMRDHNHTIEMARYAKEGQSKIYTAVIDHKQVKDAILPDTVLVRRLYVYFKPAGGGLYERIHEPHKILTLQNLYQAPDFTTNTFEYDHEELKRWISYPHEIRDISDREVRKFMPKDIAEVVLRIRSNYKR